MADFDLTQSGQEIQDILDGAAMQTDLTAEIERAEQAEQQLQGNIDIEETRAKAAEKQNADDIDVIEGKIPAAASSENQLADKNFVNSSIATNTATYRGAFNLVSDLHLTTDATEQQIATALAGAISTADNNDYCFVQIPTAVSAPTQIAAIERYKFNGTAWAYEYTLNNSGFTADQWAALNSGITTGLVAKLAVLPTNDELTLLLGGKQDVLTFDNVPTEGSNNPVKSGGVKSAIDSEKERAQGAEQANAGNIAQVIAMIPAAASSENQLADKNFVNSSITTNTATYRGAYNEVSDLSLTVDATHEQIAAALVGAISTADNNDYCFVQVPTADATPTQIAAIERYKFNGTAWAYEYTLNNSGFTSDQWAAINSGITSGLVAKLAALPTNDDLVAALAGKQPMLTFDNVPTDSSNNPVKSGGVYAAIAEEAGTRAAAIAAIVALIPSAASALNQLADKEFVNSSISSATAVFKGTFNVVADLELNYNASQAQIALMLGSKIASADNNDYCFVQIPTSNETPLEIARTDRYKYNGTAWAYEYTLNNSGFTAAQWAAINSGITSLLKDKLIDLPTATELATQLAAKQNDLTFDSTPTAGSTNPVTSDGIKAAIDTEKARALAAEQGLQDDYDDLYALYQTLEGGSIIPVAAADWPVSNPQQNVIYRVANSATPTAYSDYMYNGTNTILLADFTFPGIDSEPTPNSTNLVTSGGTFDAIMQNGPAFDLSAYNAVGGTLATYADLSAALTALNALPAAYKKGGMSMKFVHTPKNKYVQYRLMSDSFNTTETNWQGIDEQLTNSEELGKSNSVSKEITNIARVIGVPTKLLMYEKITGKFWHRETGELRIDSNATTFVIPVENVPKVKVTGPSKTYSDGYATFNTLDSSLFGTNTYSGQADKTQHDGYIELTIPTGAKSLVIFAYPYEGYDDSTFETWGIEFIYESNPYPDFSGKKIAVIGASIAAGNTVPDGQHMVKVPSYTDVAASILGMQCQNLSEGGASLQYIYGTIDNILEDTDIIVFSTDAANNSAQNSGISGSLGTIWNTDSENTRSLNIDNSISGYINQIILKLRQRFPTKFIFITTNFNQALGYTTKYAQGFYEIELDDKIWEAARVHNIPVFDLGREGCINSRDVNQFPIYYGGINLGTTDPDYSHPNEEGHKRVGKSLTGWLLRYKFML